MSRPLTQLARRQPISSVQHLVCFRDRQLVGKYKYAYLARRTLKMGAITEVSTKNAPAPLPIFSQAIKANGFVFVSGNIGIDKDTRALAEGGIEAQTAQTLKNLKAVLEASGSDFTKIVKVNIYIKDYKDFAPMNEVYLAHFPGTKPARTCVGVLDLPFGAIIEMECTALCD